ncbi:MAG TPA: GNAT family protein [Chitinophagaceae bacterium]|nr:GNAT family protein [Chitinophagaceae bacterium]
MSVLFDPSANYVLEDDCVLLRPLTPEDANILLVYARNEPDIWRYSAVPVAGEENFRRYLATALEARQSGREYPFIVFDKRSGQYAGSTRFYDIQPANQSLQLGYTWYGKAFQRTGLNRHCKYLLLNFAFEQLGMLRVEFRADTRNERSIQAMKAIGCTVEGILRSTMPNAAGGRRDSIILSILKDEWEGGLQAKLGRMLGLG